jgi:hypothetical protein
MSTTKKKTAAEEKKGTGGGYFTRAEILQYGKEFDMGVEEESEHTDDEKLVKKIVSDHLREVPDYYTRLRKMKAEAKKDGMLNKGEVTKSVHRHIIVVGDEQNKSIPKGAKIEWTKER